MVDLLTLFRCLIKFLEGSSDRVRLIKNSPLSAPGPRIPNMYSYITHIGNLNRGGAMKIMKIRVFGPPCQPSFHDLTPLNIFGLNGRVCISKRLGATDISEGVWRSTAPIEILYSLFSGRSQGFPKCANLGGVA